MFAVFNLKKKLGETKNCTIFWLQMLSFYVREIQLQLIQTSHLLEQHYEREFVNTTNILLLWMYAVSIYYILCSIYVTHI